MSMDSMDAASAMDQNEFGNEFSGEERYNQTVEEIAEGDANSKMEDDVEEGDEVELHRSQLPEGFYELEAVRKKRVRKGQVQYYIKWRDWPENTNTWEPFENLVSCSDDIDAFEERLRKGKHRSSRKRKSRSGGPVPRAKKKPQSTPLAPNTAPAGGKGKFTENLFISSPDNVSHKNCGKPKMGGINNDKTSKQITESGYTLIPPQIEKGKEQKEMEVKLVESTNKPFIGGGSNQLAADIQELEKLGNCEVISLENGHVMVDGEGVVRAGNRLGNRRRKPAIVKRFNQEQTMCATNDATQDMTTRNTRTGNVQGCKNKSDDTISDTLSITDIIQPISIAICESGHDIMFKATRSDGAVVMVDNKYLKATNPLMLIEFYEQHLKHNVMGRRN